MYISTKEYLHDDQERILYNCLGFYADGKMIGFSLNDLEIAIMSQANTWETGFNIGYYTTKGNRIKLEYFVHGDGGQYINENGTIKKDSIILEQTFIGLSLKRQTSYEVFIKSGYQLK